jgi:hypothetical protein
LTQGHPPPGGGAIVDSEVYDFPDKIADGRIVLFVECAILAPSLFLEILKALRNFAQRHAQRFDRAIAVASAEDFVLVEGDRLAQPVGL